MPELINRSRQRVQSKSKYVVDVRNKEYIPSSDACNKVASKR